MGSLWSLIQRRKRVQGRLYRFVLSRELQYLGKDTEIDPSVVFESPNKIRIEDDCRIGCGSRLVGTTIEPYGIWLGPSVRIRPYVTLYAYGGRVVLGRRVTVGEGSVVCGHGGLEIGENTMISWLCSIVPANHLFDRTDIALRHQGEERLGIRIGSNVWIGSNVTILDGVTIGNDAVVGAGAVVTRGIPPWAVAMGVPARVVGDRQKPRQKGRIRTPAKIPTGEAMTDVDPIVDEEM